MAKTAELGAAAVQLEAAKAGLDSSAQKNIRWWWLFWWWWWCGEVLSGRGGGAAVKTFVVVISIVFLNHVT